MKLLIVGAGEMGRWTADTLAAAPDVDVGVAFADADADAAREAAAARDARAVPRDTDERFDAVCLAVPISAVEAAAERHAGSAERAVFDVAGAMAEPLAAMRERAPDRERASLHPLFAPARGPGNVAFVPDAAGPVIESVREAVAAAGNRVFETTAAEHDEAMESVQAGAHAAVLAYALATDDVRGEFATPVSAALDELAATVSGGTPRVYAEIQRTFGGGADAVADAAARVADADDDAFEALYREVAARTDPARADDGPGDAGPGGERP